MEIVAGLFVFTALVGWVLMSMNGQQMSVNQLSVWRPVTPVGKFLRWMVRRLKPNVYLFVQGVLLVAGLALFGWLITSVSWGFGILPLGLTLVEVVEIRREFAAMRQVR